MRYLYLLLCLMLTACFGCRTERLVTDGLEPRLVHLVTDTSAHAPATLPGKRPGWLSPHRFWRPGHEQAITKSTNVRIKNKGTIILQNGGTGNSAAPKTTGTTKLAAGAAQATGQATARGAAKEKVITKTVTRTIRTAWWLFVLIGLLGVATGMYAGLKLSPRLSGLLLLFLLASAVAHAGTDPPKYSYKEAKRVARVHKRAARQNHRSNRHELHLVTVEHRRRLHQMRRALKAKTSGPR